MAANIFFDDGIRHVLSFLTFQDALPAAKACRAWMHAVSRAKCIGLTITQTYSHLLTSAASLLPWNLTHHCTALNLARYSPLEHEAACQLKALCTLSGHVTNMDIEANLRLIDAADATARPLRFPPLLTNLELAFQRFTCSNRVQDACIVALPSLSELVQLSLKLRDSQPDRRGSLNGKPKLAPLVDCKALRVLKLELGSTDSRRAVPQVAAYVEVLRRLPLEALLLHNDLRITVEDLLDNGPHRLHQFHTLEASHLHSSVETEAVELRGRLLATLPRLRDLRSCQPPCTWKYLQHLRALEALSVSNDNTGSTTQLIRALSVHSAGGYSRLLELRLIGFRFESHQVSDLLLLMPNISSIRFHRCGISDGSTSALAVANRLKHLEFFMCALDPIFKLIADALVAVPSLEKLDFSDHGPNVPQAHSDVIASVRQLEVAFPKVKFGIISLRYLEQLW
jgi:hypothetical protein